MLANLKRDPSKQRDAFEPGDFMPEQYKPKPVEQTPEDMLKFLKHITKQMGGIDTTGEV